MSIVPEQKAKKYAYNRQWKKDHPDWDRQQNYKRHEKLKKQVFAAYGNICECCKESDLHFLTLDHISGFVPEEHKKNGRRMSGTEFLYFLRRENFPAGIRILCWNCNCSYGYYGFCPHQPHKIEDRRYQ